MDVAKIPGLIADLDSSDPEVKLQAIDGFGEAMQTMAERVVQHLSDPEPWRYFVLERLVRLGSLALTPLERLLRESTDRDTRLVAAICLLGLDSDAGVLLVLDAVRPEEPYLCLAVRVLARRRVSAAIPLIEDVLRACDICEQKLTTISCLVDALRVLGRSVPDELRERVRTAQPDWVAKGLLRQLDEEPRI